MWQLVRDGTKNNDKILNPTHLHDRFKISTELYHVENKNKLIIDLMR